MPAINVYTVPLPIHIMFYAIGAAVIEASLMPYMAYRKEKKTQKDESMSAMMMRCDIAW